MSEKTRSPKQKSAGHRAELQRVVEAHGPTNEDPRERMDPDYLGFVLPLTPLYGVCTVHGVASCKGRG